ncbi:MAG: right-handed parallel beta-helix repeat-containing protein, partial [Anaerolineae bacterium]
VYTATSQFNPTIYDAAAFSGQVYDTATDTTVVEQLVAVDLLPGQDAQRGLCVVAPGQAHYEYTVHNTGNYTDTFDITAQSEHGWTTNIYFTPVTLGPDEQRTVLVVLEVPNVAGQFTDHLVVTATSRTDDTVWDTHETDTSVNWNVNLELEPDRSSWLILESSVTYTHVLTNTGDDPNTFQLTYKSSQGWPVNISPSTVTNLQPGHSALISVTVNVPAGIISATDTTIVTATATLYCEAEDFVEDVTIVGRPDLILEPDNEGIAPPGTPITYTHYLTNTGGITDTYSLSVVNDLGWSVSALPPTVNNLSPGGVAEVLVVVNVPLGTEAGTVSLSEVKATSSYAAYIYDTAVDTTTVPYVPSALLEPDCNRQADPGATVVCTHTLANTGNFTETFFLTTRGEFAQATVQPKTIGPLSPGQAYPGTVTVTIQIPDNAGGGQTEETELIATFAGAEGQSVQVDRTYINYIHGTRYVAPAPYGLNNNNNCLVLEYGPCATVQQAADQALPGDLIKVATGTYSDVRTRAGHEQVLFLQESLVVRGGYANDDWALSAPYTRPTTLDAQSQGRVVYIAGEGITPTLEGLRLTGGAVIGSGGGLYVDSGAAPVLRLSNIFSNTAASGGGFYYAGGAAPFLERNTFFDNQATHGGAFFMAGGAPLLQNNLVYANHVVGNGGALYGQGSNAVLRNNTLFDNRAGGLGGGIYLSTGSPIISHTIVASSTNYGLYNATGAPILAYNTVWGSSVADYSPGLLPGPGSISANPRFAAPDSYDLHLSGASPCIDAGQPGVAQPPEDYEGNPRPMGPRYDVGAFEYVLSGAKAGPATAGPGEAITYTLTVANNGLGDQFNVLVTDTLHSYLDYAGGLAYSSGTGQYLPASRTISWMGDVPAGSTVYITFTARITDWLAAGTVVSNVAYVDLGATLPATTTIDAQPGTRHVAPAGDDTDNNCLVSGWPCATVQYAVDQALDSDTVKVAGGTYTDTLGSGCVVSVTQSLSLVGGFAPASWLERDPLANPTTLDAQGTTHGLCIAG